jgi:hypothetical protein
MNVNPTISPNFVEIGGLLNFLPISTTPPTSGTQEILFFITHPTVTEQRNVTTSQNGSVGIETIATLSWPSQIINWQTTETKKSNTWAEKHDGSG